MTRLGDDVRNDFTTGQTTVGTSAVQLTSSDVKVSRGVTVKADDSNANSVWYGRTSSVTSGTGFRLDAGQAKTIQVDNANKIYLIAGASDQKVCWEAL